ncbi:uncharacterized protein LOC129584915 [Paramacrobiotus metropolitanus]|uniref:uncharacterized protein LOC129584915 n=1 Tax=Paramacrobiotus metropolitanus TaxID=2943436 RepID=UPI0024463C2C|nr:uncharacterized protein LOC129584915 [Paramacrobiotus metropolitanus]XP_055333319.1 uncharacterized protein LOC129584915 [Paramacrobiotus metropolitanus]XP_055333320.1 uncharacterized protein LOC129584915 [Paramacrobiotus metropolitanus]
MSLTAINIATDEYPKIFNGHSAPTLSGSCAAANGAKTCMKTGKALFVLTGDSTSVGSTDGNNYSRLTELATEADKKVSEFNALIADVESRSRNQKVLLERLFETQLSFSKSSAAAARPTKLDLLTTSANANHMSATVQQHTTADNANKLIVDELPDFGPLSKKLRSNGVTTSPVASARRFSASSASSPTIATSLPRTQYGRKGSVPATIGSSSSALLTLTSPHATRRTGPPEHQHNPHNASPVSLITKATADEHNHSVDSLVKLFSENSPEKSCVDCLSKASKRANPNAVRLLVRCPDGTVYSENPLSAGLPPNGRRLPTADNNGTNGEVQRSMPTFASTCAFLNKLKLKNGNGLEFHLGKMPSKQDTSQLESLLAGLNFSKFRITDRLGSCEHASKCPPNEEKRTGRQAAVPTAATAAAAGAKEAKVGQKNSLHTEAGINGCNTRADHATIINETAQPRLPPPDGVMRALSQPENDQNSDHLLGILRVDEADIPVIRKERLRVTLSEDRESTLFAPAMKHSAGTMYKVSEDIASLISDIRQHFQLYRKCDHVAQLAARPVASAGVDTNTDTKLRTATTTVDKPPLSEDINTDTQSVNGLHDDSGNTVPVCPATPATNRRDSDYVISVVSDDYSESTGPVDETMETESTSSSFTFSPTVSTTHSAFNGALSERDYLISGSIHALSSKRQESRAVDTDEKTPLPTLENITDPGAHMVHMQTTDLPAKTEVYVNGNSESNRKAYVNGSSLTFPPQPRKGGLSYPENQFSNNIIANTTASSWDIDNPENRLSSSSFPESSISLTDSVYSTCTAASSSLRSYMDPGSVESSARATQSAQSDTERPEVDARKLRYHSDPTPSAQEFSKPGSIALYSISEPVLPNAPATSDVTNSAAKSVDEAENSDRSITLPLSIKDDLIRESGGIMTIDARAWPGCESAIHNNAGADNVVCGTAPAAGEKQTANGSACPTAAISPSAPGKANNLRAAFHASFRHGDKHQPRGPFGICLQEEQLRRERAGYNRQFVHDLSFLNSPEPSPGTPEHVMPENGLVPELTENGECKERHNMPKRRQSAQLLAEEKLARHYVGMKSSPNLFFNVVAAAGLSDSAGSALRPGDICRSASDADATNWKKHSDDTDSAVYSGSTESVPSSESISSRAKLHPSTKRATDFRTHIAKELYDTEKTYVESLQILEKYFETLKGNEDLVEKTLAENMFYQIPAIKCHHENLLTELKRRMECWDTRQKIGDVIVHEFTKESVIDTYTAFINNWKTAKDAIKLAKITKPNFAKFLEQCAREHRGKLNLDALLIMPVQRIPRYELLIKELLKHTAEDHPDRIDLESAQNQVHELALKINAMEAEVDEAERMMIRLKELEMYIDGLNDLVEPNRKFLKFDMVTMASGNMGLKKDRCLFLFSDLLVITNLKRKSGTIRKPSSNSCSPQLYPTLENNKYKLLMKISLADLELARSALTTAKKPFVERDLLESDLGVLNKISELTGNLSASHQPLDDAVRNMISVVNRQLTDRQAHSHDPNLSKLELTVPTQHGLEAISINFLSAGKKNAWEKAFLEAKQVLGLSIDRRPPPDFLCSIPIRKTRAGMQITCSAATTDLNACDLRDVWVCNSDGYVGQICVLSMQPEPALTSCITACGCKITCIASVPASTGLSKGSVINSRNTSPVSDHSSSGDTHNPPTLNLELDSDDSTDEDASIDDHSRSLPNSDKDSFLLMSEDDHEQLLMSVAGKSQNPVPDPSQGTMWIGTEDGCILVYYCNDNIRIKKPRLKLQHSSAVQSIAYTDQTVFVGLANGQVAVYSRSSQGVWETTHPVYIQLGSPSAPVQRMTLACGKVWCACLNVIHVINPSTLKVENTFSIGSDASRPLSCMAASGLGVWMSVQNSAVLRLCNAITFDFLADINLTPSVQKMLAGCDEILRQHKFACLRITALLACKELLWVGTSAGVILTVNLPHIQPGTTRLNSSPTLTGIWHGHTGQVRFLHCVEQNIIGSIGQSTNGNRSNRRHSASAAVQGTKMLVVSGGDGYEDFRSTSFSVAATTGTTDGAGRDDSTNHLLLWQC